ncbi:MAG: hypothetical protein ACD_11C00028G0013 [uncultured bacterium]|nr:MAG: hypothetical protein ACD_11C00028G0013 [uncultured bacterium]HBR71609.1 hypothetical protein [Candidatus Moranbacteria bacterium]
MYSRIFGFLSIGVALSAILAPITATFYIVWLSIALGIISALGGYKAAPFVVILMSGMNFLLIKLSSFKSLAWQVLIDMNGEQLFYKHINVTMILLFVLLMAIIHCKPINKGVAVPA